MGWNEVNRSEQLDGAVIQLLYIPCVAPVGDKRVGSLGHLTPPLLAASGEKQNVG